MIVMCGCGITLGSTSAALRHRTYSCPLLKRQPRPDNQIKEPCQKCGKVMLQRSLKMHMRRVHHA